MAGFEPRHSIVARISTHPPDDGCVGVIVPPVGCYPTQPMLESLHGGVYNIELGGEFGSLISLPPLAHGSFRTIETAASPTGSADNPLPIDW